MFTVNKFWMFSRQSLVRTFEPVFITVQSDFKSKKVTKRVVSILDVLKDPSEHAEVRR